MSSLLYDHPGPHTRARYRTYTIISGLVLLGLVALVLWQMNRTGQLAYRLWEPFITPAYVEALLVDGLLKTLAMAFSSIVLAVVFGVAFGLGKFSDHGWIRWPCWVVVEFFRAVPVLLMMIFIYYTYGQGGGGIGSYWSVVIALMLYNGSVLAEVFRAGINAVPKGQGEAAYAIGLRKSQVMSSILLPQAVKIMLPALISQCVVALKDTALGYVILAPGLTEVGKAIYLEFGNQVQAAIVMAVLFIIVNLILTGIATWLQRKLVGERKPLDVGVVGPTDQAAGAAV